MFFSVTNLAITKSDDNPSETSHTCQPTENMVCEVCCDIAKYYYYNTLQQVEKQIHQEYHATFKKYFNLFSKFNKKHKVDWMLAYIKTQDYEDTYHSDVQVMVLKTSCDFMI